MSAVEYETREYKKSLSEWKDAVDSVAAFATAGGGSVIFGIDPSGKRVGVQLGANSLEVLANDIKSNTQPSQFPSISVEGDEGKAVVTVRVEESPVKPVWAFGRPYKRVGRTNQRLSPDETKRLMELTSGRTWDALTSTLITEDAFDENATRNYLGRANQDRDTPLDSVLHTLGLKTQEGVSNGAVLLFAKSPQQFLPSALVKCARFRGANSVDFLDQQTFEGTVLEQIDNAISFVQRNTEQAIRITGSASRETVSEYPDVAFREAIVNAVCHRDYGATGTVQVRIYLDRLEIWNPGMLPNDLTVEDLYNEHPSRPRNPRLASALFRTGIIEQWGTGTLRIVRACEAAGMPRPEFSSGMGVFIIRFLKPFLSRFDADTQSRLRSFAMRIGQGSFDGLLTAFHERQRLTTRQVADILNVSLPTVRNYLRQLQEIGLVTPDRQARTDPRAAWTLASRDNDTFLS